jgi:nucleotide-binding universal stress UspA family protein
MRADSGSPVAGLEECEGQAIVYRTREEGQMFKSIVWATDGSEHAEKAFALVHELAKEGGATVTIVHVVERVEAIGGTGQPRRVDEGAVQDHLREVVDRLKAEGMNASLKISGDVGARPANEVVKAAREEGADLIVAGSRGHHAITGLLLGSVTNRLLHIAPCPVLVVPPGAAGA